MKIYHYSGNQNIYTRTTEARKDPLEEGKYLIPAKATMVEPPTHETGQTVKFNVKRNKWIIVEDYRGKIITHKYTYETKVCTTVGSFDDSEWTFLERPDNGVWDTTQNKWVIDQTEIYKQEVAKAKMIRDSIFTNQYWRIERCQAEIRLGLKTTEDLIALDKYFHKLRHLDKLAGYPNKIEWPIAPWETSDTVVTQ